MPRDDLLKQHHVREARVAVVDPVGRVRAVRDDVHRELPARALHPPEPVALLRPEPAPRVAEDRPLGHLLDNLLDQPDALEDLADADPVARRDVSGLVGDHVEVELRVDAVGVVAPRIERDARPPKRRSRNPDLNGLLRRHPPDAPRAGDVDLVPDDKVHDVRLKARPEPVHVLVDLLKQPGRHVGLHPADPDVVEHHPCAADRLKEALDLLPLAERIQDGRKRSKLQHKEPERRDMARKAHKLAHEHAQVLRPRRYLHVEQVLDRQAVAVLVEHARQVVEPVGERDDLRVHPVLGDLLLRAVQVAHNRVAPHHRLAVELQDKPQETVHRRVLRPHVHVHRLKAELVPDIRVG